MHADKYLPPTPAEACATESYTALALTKTEGGAAALNHRRRMASRAREDEDRLGHHAETQRLTPTPQSVSRASPSLTSSFWRRLSAAPACTRHSPWRPHDQLAVRSPLAAERGEHHAVTDGNDARHVNLLRKLLHG